MCAKCSDMFSARFHDDNKLGPIPDGEYDGYVPTFFPGQNGGDYVELEIDIDTGNILNWKIPSRAQLKATFELKHA